MNARVTLCTAAAAVSIAAAACGGTQQPSIPRANAQTATASSSSSSESATSKREPTIPKAHPQVVQPKAGSQSAPPGPAGKDPVGDPTAHARPLSKVKAELARLNLCGGTDNPADATPFGTNHRWGFVADPGTIQNVGRLPIITRDLNALGQYLHVTIYGISGYRSPAHSVAVGGYADDPHTRGEAEDIGVNSLLRASAAQITEAQLARFGLYRPFDPTDDPNNPEVNHVQLIPHGGPVPLTVVQDTFDPDPSCR